ncbi:MAG: Nif3-like dinuclear metal center hexameric protein [Sulfurimonas sp. RIFCSPLOWO2_12_FULL_36_74]|uniref:Nif3-like dinuclear metal center hexameric protein n=1 Tax=Sulfurimonas sp. RIFCSPLOWO2_12_36_12 TaxID=1802253 RepID=UPI0008D864E3|nr:Nif3-like dinuclear metal center hexameric protein [Sulfurimonas sp. RIFCSPLOWO2_12_36_12]OHD97863.1 MAG: Nif3-like dinuclear metal center hexameric protein [Sulfurimonas sp. RIFCSPLOWO2_02_FULL_36_28]OHE00953.1 MAG: Nif3-like dinuclear metal center hexameric protein [Sulfurimonas sp. RIFCSPLOWO2_12_36_12]OHE06958.1 MAG: Nif3-like dinuclear metal center hexameric protein [Sulfurimonas sp. RIFCSPLOWO2_12_FULL_36_74]
MKTSEIYDFLDKLSPFELQEPWDNSGLLLGDFNQDIQKIVLSIDVDEALIDSMEENTLLITHHPLIFGGLKQLEFSKYPANLIHKMIQKNISNISMHTNFDQTHLNEYVATEVLGYKIAQKDGFVAYLDIDEDFDIFASKVAAAFSLPHAKCVKSSQRVKRAALTTGSGCSLIKSIKADCFLTGDVKYHDAMEAKSINLSLIDIGHFESEQFFAEILLKHLKNLGLEAIISSSKNPFTYI